MTTPAPRTDRPGERRFRDLLERERHDVAMLAGHVAEMYDHITSGRVSKPNTKPFEVIALYEERLEEECREAAAEAVAPWRAALDYAKQIIGSYELDCRHLPDYLAQGGDPAGFCQGVIYRDAIRDIEARALLTDTQEEEKP